MSEGVYWGERGGSVGWKKEKKLWKGKKKEGYEILAGDLGREKHVFQVIHTWIMVYTSLKHCQRHNGPKG